MEPQFKHDCSRCHFLGGTRIPTLSKDPTIPVDFPADLYLCEKEKPEFSEFLARHGDDGEYISGHNPLFFKTRTLQPWEALIVERAKEKGVWKE